MRRKMIPAKNRWIVLYRDSFACQDCASKARFFDQFGRLREKDWKLIWKFTTLMDILIILIIS